MSAALSGCVSAVKRCVWSFNIGRRWLSSKTVDVRCGSSPPVSLYLHNTDDHSPNNPLWIYLPPDPTPLATAADIHPLPPFLRSRPTVTIGYRWFPCRQSTADYESPLCWPTPCHDIGFAWDWIQTHLGAGPEHQPTTTASPRPESDAPDEPQSLRRHVYVFGSRLGAGLATSLAVNTCNPADRFSIRGVVAYNGIYNWSMFLPEHRIHDVPTDARPEYLDRRAVAAALADHQLRRERDGLVGWFATPANLFDPWASTSLHWRGEDMMIRRSFDPDDTSGFFSPRAPDAIPGFDGPADLDDLDDPDEPCSYDWITDRMPPNEILRGLERTGRRPRLVSFRFPQSYSPLTIPKTLLLYDALPEPPPAAEAEPTTTTTTTTKKHQRPVHVNSYATQTLQLAELMRQGIRRNEVLPKLKILYDERERAEAVLRPFERISTVSFNPHQAQSFRHHDKFGHGLVNAWLSGDIPTNRPSRDWQRWMEKMAYTESPSGRWADCHQHPDAIDKYRDEEAPHTGHVLGLMEDPHDDDHGDTPDPAIVGGHSTQAYGDWESQHPD